MWLSELVYTHVRDFIYAASILPVIYRGVLKADVTSRLIARSKNARFMPVKNDAILPILGMLLRYGFGSEKSGFSFFVLKP